MQDSRETPQAYPLAWPFGWKRTEYTQRGRAGFGQGSGGARGSLDVDAAVRRLENEIRLLGVGEDWLLSTNIKPRLSSRIISADPKADPGAACYFKLRGRDLVLACDKWDRLADNIAAIAAHIGAMRGMERWGVGSVEQRFAGYEALPPPGRSDKRPWRKVLMLDGGPLPSGQAAVDIVKERFRQLAAERHPDKGGNHDLMAELNAAYAEALHELQGAPAHV